MTIIKRGITGPPNGRTPNRVQKWLAQVLGTGFGTGMLPFAQGTAASALFVAIWILAVPADPLVEIVVAVAVNLASVPISTWGERLWGPDPGRITIDEFAGQAVALAALPREPILLLASFLLFRIFDSFKLPFIRRRIEPLPEGWGITLDDTIAGLIARILLIPIGMILA